MLLQALVIIDIIIVDISRAAVNHMALKLGELLP
jgi:hypothetical protein